MGITPQSDRLRPGVLRPVSPLWHSPFARRPADSSPAVPWATANVVQPIAFFVLSVYLLGGFANDIVNHLMRGKAYLSLIAGLLLPVVCLLTGRLFRAFRYAAGAWWAFLMFWLVVAVPFSTWRGGSATHLINFIAKSSLLMLYIPAATFGVKYCSRLFHVQAIGTAIVLISCVFYGDYKDERLWIPGSLFFNNPNDLATYMVFSGAFLLYLILSPNWFSRIFGLGLITAAVFTITKTGSRGLFLALGACLLATFVLSRNKIKLLVIGLPITVLAIVTLPQATRSRLVYIVLTEESAPVTMLEDGDYGSQMQRIELVKKAVEFTFRYPVFGVGPAMFPEAVWTESKLTGVHTPFLNTHNGYVQVSSEAGIPAFIAFVAILFLTVKTNYQLLRRTRDDPALRSLNAMAFALLIASIGYAVASLSHHLAYTFHLPLLAGTTLAVREAAAPFINRPKPAGAGAMWGAPALTTNGRPRSAMPNHGAAG